MDYLEIEKVIGREIMDSRGNPTVEAEVYLADGTVAVLRQVNLKHWNCVTAIRADIWGKVYKKP